MAYPLGRADKMTYAMLLLPGLLGAVALSSCRKKKARWLLMMLVLGVSTVWLPACGGGSGGNTTPSDPGTPVGAKTITVTASTSGSSPLTHKVTFTLSVLQ